MVEAELRLASGGARVRSDERFCQVALGAPPLRVAMGPWRPLTSLKPSHMRLKTGRLEVLFFLFLLISPCYSLPLRPASKKLVDRPKFTNQQDLIQNNIFDGARLSNSETHKRILIGSPISAQHKIIKRRLEDKSSSVDKVNNLENYGKVVYSDDSQISEGNNTDKVEISKLLTILKSTSVVETLNAPYSESLNEALLSNDYNSGSVRSTPVTRVQRDAATFLEGGEETFLEESPQQGGMDYSDRDSHWSTPCRLDTSKNPLSTVRYHSNHIYNNLNVVHKHMHRFKSTYATAMWDGLDWETSLTLIAEAPLSFLTLVAPPPKHNSDAFDDVLLMAYDAMQRQAVAIEQVTLDQALYSDVNSTDFLSEFRVVEGEIVSVLCEMRYAMLQRGVQPREVSAEIMPEKYRDIDSSSGRTARDTLILRDFIKILDALLAYFEHFRAQPA